MVAIAAETTRRQEVRTILLVEDFAPLLRRWVRELQHAGKRVLAASNGDAAIELARQAKPDLAVVDLFLTSENGITVIRRLREKDNNLYAVMRQQQPR